MSINCAIVGLEQIQKDWVDAIAQARDAGKINIVAVAQLQMGSARNLGQRLDAPFYVDFRRMMLEATPQIVILDRPRNFSLDFIIACIQQEIGIFSLGPPVQNLNEARKLSLMLEPVTPLLYIWPRMTSSWAMRQCRNSEDYLSGLRFLAGNWTGITHSRARDWPAAQASVRSLSVLAWDACRTVIETLGVPASVFAAVQGELGNRDRFTDVNGSVCMTLRFIEATASLVVCDHDSPLTRTLSLFNASQLVTISDHAYNVRAASNGEKLEQDSAPAQSFDLPWKPLLAELDEFCTQFVAPPTPDRGWPHFLTETAATLTAMMVSHRTGAAESPQHFRGLHG